MFPFSPHALLSRRQMNGLLAGAAICCSSTASSADNATLAAEASKLTALFLDLVDAGKGEEAVSRYVDTSFASGSPASTPEQRHLQIQKYIVDRVGVGALSNRRIIDVKVAGPGARLWVRYAAPENPRQGTNNRRLARHNEYLDVAAQPDGTLKITGFGFAD